jgi:transcription elongation factor GreA
VHDAVVDELTLTSAGIEALRRELARLRVELAAAGDRLAASVPRAGDAGEVGEYLDAQREHELLYHRVALIEEWLDGARTLEVTARAHDAVELGAHTEFEDLDTGESSSFELVSSPESNIARGRLSVDSPVGHALFGHHAGDIVEVLTPKGRRHLRVIAVR